MGCMPVDCSLTIAYCERLKAEQNSFDFYGQATKGTGWMPWCQEAKKDVVSCDKPWGAAKQALIQGSLNGGTLSVS